MEHRSPAHPLPDKLERLGRYRIVRPLSKGGMALVYEARREGIAGVSARVAIKLILPEHAGTEGFQELFINEARLGASMHHQNLVQIQDFDRDGDKFFLVMEYVEGLTLRRMVSLCHRANLPIPLGVIAEVGRQACDGLHYAHAATDERGKHLGLVHRDVKPSNLILNPHGVVKVLDFGISKGVLMREKKGAVKGTWGYMAPEQAAGKEVGPTSDVFALATVLFEMAALRPIFDLRQVDDHELVKRLLDDDHSARMATQLDPALYQGLMNVLVRALQRDPAGRFANASDFGRALSALLPDPITARDEVTRFYQLVYALDQGRQIPNSARPITASNAGNTGGSIVVTGGEPEPGPSVLWIIAGSTVLALGAGALLVLAFGAKLGFDQGLLDRASAYAGLDEPHQTALPPPSPGEAAPPPVAVTPPPPPAAVEPVQEPAGPAAEPIEAAPVVEAPPPPKPKTERPPPAATVAPPERVGTSDGLTVLPPLTAGPLPDEVKVVVVRREDGSAIVPTTPSAPIPAAPQATTGSGLVTISAIPSGFEIYIDGRLVNKGPITRQQYPAGHHQVTIVAADGRTQSFELDLENAQEVRKIWDFDRGEWRR